MKKLSRTQIINLISVFIILSLAFLSGHNLTQTEVRQVGESIQAVLGEQIQLTQPTNQPETDKQIAIVARVIDGDTIELTNGKKVRYLGINTPETKAPKKIIECFGKEASQRNRELVEGKQIALEKNVSETDKYGRLLRYVYVDDQMVNELLVKEGFAQVSAYPPDVKYQELFIKAEQKAREQKLGLWSTLCDDILSP